MMAPAKQKAGTPTKDNNMTMGLRKRIAKTASGLTEYNPTAIDDDVELIGIPASRSVNVVRQSKGRSSSSMISVKIHPPAYSRSQVKIGDPRGRDPIIDNLLNTNEGCQF